LGDREFVFDVQGHFVGQHGLGQTGLGGADQPSLFTIGPRVDCAACAAGHAAM
jgi:hypothetical protein